MKRVRAARPRRREVRLRTESLEHRQLLAVGPVITEFMADNANFLQDEDGEYSDWIEVYNPTDAPVNLAGYHLTDDDEVLDLWTFPDVTLPARGFMLVFASGQDRIDAGELHTNFRLSVDGEYLALVAPDGVTIQTEFSPGFPAQQEDVSYGVAQGTSGVTLLAPDTPGRALVPNAQNGPGLALDWTARVFNDSGWRSGSTGWGYDLEPTYRSLINTDLFADMYGGNTTAYLRVPFQVDDPLSINSLTLRLKYDDGFVAYLNGEWVASTHAPVTPSWDDASSDLNPDSVAVIYEDFDVTAYKNALVAGTNVLAIQGLNVSSGSSDFLIMPEITATIAGEVEERYGYFKLPTPGAANDTQPTDGFVADTKFSVDRGYFDAPFDVAITTETADAAIRYTTDGSEPTLSNGITYAGPIHVAATTVLRAAAFKLNFEPSNADSQTYLFLGDVIRQSPNGAPPPGWPSSWGGNVVNYGMDQSVVNANIGTIIDDLKAIPSMSIVMDLDDMFGPSGIYANPGGEGAAWERETSLELINPNGSEGFQVNAGIRIRGGFSRSTSNPKHAFRLFFRREYGDGKLNYPLFGAEGAGEFDKIDLRTDQNYSWSFGNDSRHTAVRDVFSRDTQRDMGQPYARSRYYHLYINGQYWGMFQSQERTEAAFGETYFGGDRDNYDTVKAEAGPYDTRATDGNLEAFRRFWEGANAVAAAATAAERAALYQKLLGNNPDGTRNPNYEVLLDAHNLIDYMLVIVYGGNLDAPISNFLGNTRVNNWYGVRERNGLSGGWKFFAHDNEHTLLSLTEDRTGPYSAGSSFTYANPQWIWQQLWTSEDFRLAVADRVQKHFFNGGALTPEAARARFQSRADEIDRAIVGESARWGNSGLSRNTWLNAIQFVTSGITPTRGNNVLNQLNLKGLVSTQPAPTFSSYGGDVQPGFTLDISATSGAYYTTDGSDPRLPEGGVNPAATFIPGGDEVLVYDASHPAKIFVPTTANGGSSLGTTWSAPNFDDSTWMTGTAGVGFDLMGDYQGAYGTDVQQQMHNVNSGVYLRTEFNVPNPAALNDLNLRVKYDDGFIVLLNGQRVASRNAPPLRFGYNSVATEEHPDEDALEFESVSLTGFKNLLLPGRNVLAFQALNRAVNNDDFLFVPELFTFGEPQSAQLVLNESTRVRARGVVGNQWSAEVTADFRLPSAVRVTEIMYNPLAPPAGSPFAASDFEFIELQNTGTQTLNLAGYKLSGGIDFEFGDYQLAPGAYVVVANHQAAFESRYGAGLPVAGEFVGNLSNSGETIRLDATLNALVQEFTFSDAWHPLTDGEGLSLTIVDAGAALDDWNIAAGWKASSQSGGTPGRPDAPFVLGDTNGDGAVNVIDLNNVRNNFGASGPGVLGDTNGDGEVDVVDLNNVRNNFGAVAPSPFTQSRTSRGVLADAALESWAPFDERSALSSMRAQRVTASSPHDLDVLLWHVAGRNSNAAVPTKRRR